MSYPTHLLRHKGHFYYKIKVPVDLQQHFPYPFIKKSLRTPDLREAKTMLAAMEFSTYRCFTMLRTGLLPEDMARLLVEEIVPNKQKAAVLNGKVLSEVIKQYVEAKESGWSAKSKMEFYSVFKLLVDMLGDVGLTSVSRSVVTELLATLQKLPPNMYKKYPGKTVKQVLALKDIEPMSTKSVNKHVSRLGALLRYCIEEGMIKSNPAYGPKISEKKRPDEERDAYSKADIAKIISSLPVNLSIPERYWIPLIGLYTGMRLNEICQLYVSDIVSFDGLWCLSINGEKDKRLKNDASERVISVHPTLLDLGLLGYVEQLKNSASPRLWMNLNWCDINDYSNSFGKWYQRYNRHYVTDDSKKVFHSMHHLATDTLKQTGIIENSNCRVCGSFQ